MCKIPDENMLDGKRVTRGEEGAAFRNHAHDAKELVSRVSAFGRERKLHQVGQIQIQRRAPSGMSNPWSDR